MANVIIFGTNRLASVAHYCLRHDSPHEVVAFAVVNDGWPLRPFKPRQFEDLPVVPLEELEEAYPPEDVSCYAPASVATHHRRCKSGYELLKPRGYSFVSYTSTTAVVAPDTVVGENCMIQENCTIQPCVRMGDNVTIGAGSVIGHHTTIADHVLFGPHAVICSGCTIESGCIFEANTTLVDCRRSGRWTVVTAGTTIHHNTAVGSVYNSPSTVKAKFNSGEL